MSEIEKILKDVLYGSVGVVATAVEKTGELARNLVNKGADMVSPEKTGAYVKKGQDVLNAIGERFAALKEQIVRSLNREETPAEEVPAELEHAMDELDTLETELEAVESRLTEETESRDVPVIDVEKAADAAGEKAEEIADKTEAFAEKACGEAEKVMDSLADKAEAFLNSGKLQEAADRLTQEGGKLFQKVEAAIDGALNPSPEKKEAEEKAQALPDTESILQSLSQRLEDFARRLSASRKALEDQEKDKNPDRDE